MARSRDGVVALMMNHNKIPDNTYDIIDSREVLKAIEFLEDDAEGIWNDQYPQLVPLLEWTRTEYDYATELNQLMEFSVDASEVEDWAYGAIFVRDSHFVDYAKQYASDIGAIDVAADWPHTFIDWAAAAQELKDGYTSYEFDGVTYWARS